MWRVTTSRETLHWWTATYFSSAVYCQAERPGKEPRILRACHYQPLPPTVCLTRQHNLPQQDAYTRILPKPQNKNQLWTTHHQGGYLGSASQQWWAKTSPVQADTLANPMIPQESSSTKRWDAHTYPNTAKYAGRMSRHQQLLLTSSTLNYPGWPTNLTPASWQQNESHKTKLLPTSTLDGSTTHQSRAYYYLHIFHSNPACQQILLKRTLSFFQTNPRQCPPPTGMTISTPMIQKTNQCSRIWSVIII